MRILGVNSGLGHAIEGDMGEDSLRRTMAVDVETREKRTLQWYVPITLKIHQHKLDCCAT